MVAWAFTCPRLGCPDFRATALNSRKPQTGSYGFPPNGTCAPQKRRLRSTGISVSTRTGERPEPLSPGTAGLRRKRVLVMQTAQHRAGEHERAPPPFGAGIPISELELVQIAVEDRARQGPMRCAGVHGCNEPPTVSGWIADEPQTSESSSPSILGGWSQSNVRRWHSPSGWRRADDPR